MTVAIIFGVLALGNNPSYYFSEGFMRAKFVAVGFAVLATIALTIACRKLQSPEPTVSERAIKLWRGLFMGAIAAAVVLIFARPL